MDTTEWFHITTGQFGYPQPEKDSGYLNTTYDLTHACPTCHVGLKQINEFHFKSEPKSQRSQFIGLNWVFDQIFIRPIVQEIFQAESVTGIYFSTPHHHKTKKPLESIRQIHVDTMLTNGINTDNLNTETCEYPKDESPIKFLTAIGSSLIKGPFCKQLKYNYPQGNPFILKKSLVENMPDIFRLSEWFGSGGSASQPIFISKKVSDIIIKQSWRGAFFKPAELY